MSLLQRVSVLLLCLVNSTAAMAAEYMAPPSGSGPAVVVISGASGTAAYRWYARDVAKLGYSVALVAGWQICAASSGSCSRSNEDSAANLKATIEELQGNPRTAPGKVVVIGFSLGGGGALVHAAPLSEAVAGVVAYYPSITRLPDLNGAAARVAVPTLLLSGEQDRYFNCCLIESMRAFEAGVRAKSVPVELVAYPQADHAFNLDGPKHRPEETADAWQRTQAFLARVLPLK